MRGFAVILYAIRTSAATSFPLADLSGIGLGLCQQSFPDLCLEPHQLRFFSIAKACEVEEMEQVQFSPMYVAYP
jgi:hypothetical protein